MTLKLPDLSRTDAGVQEVLAQLAGLDPAVPLLLLPVRIETRFATSEVPVEQPATLIEVRALLEAIARALSAIAERDLATALPPGARARHDYKLREEAPRYAFVDEQLALARAALARLSALLRGPVEGSAEEEKAVEGAAKSVAAALPAALQSIARLRSAYQRDRLGAALGTLEEEALALLRRLQRRVLPAGRLRRDLSAVPVPAALARREEARLLRLVGWDAPDALPRVLRGSPAEAAQLGAARVEALSHDRLAAGAEAYVDLLERVGRLRDGREVPALLEACQAIPILPERWRAQLAEAVASRRAVPGADALEEAVAGIHSDAARLDGPRARPGVVVLPPLTRTQHELRVRIFPDDIAVDAHEDRLTATEQGAGAVFWSEWSAAGRDEPARRAAWRALCIGRRPGRAAWIARRTRPPEPEPTPGALRGERALEQLEILQKRIEEVALSTPGDRVPALVRALEGLAAVLEPKEPLPAQVLKRLAQGLAAARAKLDRLVLEASRRITPAEVRAIRLRLLRRLVTLARLLEATPVEPTPPPVGVDSGDPKEGAWTQAARSGVLPSRFAVIAIAGDDVRHVATGKRIDAGLKLGLDPTEPAAATFRVDEDGTLHVGASIRWMVEYGEAVDKGMAVTLPITPEDAAAGFDAVYVLGIRPDGAEDGARRVTDLVDHHHYGPSGLALVPVGTATNNAEGRASGWGSQETPDAAFRVELGDALFDRTAPADQASDGLRLARALGIDPDLLAHVAGAEGKDGAEALVVNRAIYPATIGNALEELAAPLVPLDARDRLRTFALGNVAGRGLIPSFRVGSQPYGVLPTTAYRLFAPAAGESPALPPGAAEAARQLRFDALFHRVLMRMWDDWSGFARERVAHAGNPGEEDAQAHFLRMLGLEATSRSAAHRYALNVAGRSGGIDPGARFGPMALLARFEPVLREAFGIPQGPLLEKGAVAEDVKEVFERIEGSRSFELNMIDRHHPLRGEIVGPDHPAVVAQLLSASPLQLHTSTWSAPHHGVPLLHLLARHALLVSLRDAALGILAEEEMIDEAGRVEAGASSRYQVGTLTGLEQLTLWSALFAPLLELDGRIGPAFETGAGTLYDHLAQGTAPLANYLAGRSSAALLRPAHARHVAELQRHAAAIEALRSIPAKRLEPLLMEHLDVASHRLDAWLVGLAQRRLSAMRSVRPTGIHVGAYGWVEGLRPDDEVVPASNVPPSLADASRPIHRDKHTQGFVHAPSLNHAVTAAILRGGYLAQRGAGDVENRMAVNLSSRRVRLALELMDGVREGNDLGSLLGYRLERSLHEAYAVHGVTVDSLIAPLRRAYPSTVGVDGSVGSLEVAERSVCDGLAIVEAVNGWVAARVGGADGRTVYEVISDGGRFGGYPWGLLPAGVPAAPDRATLDSLARAVDQGADALDAVADLVVAESVHQTAMGNHARAAATLAAFAEGRAPPPPEVVHTPRSGTPLTHRIILQLPAGGAAPGWEGIPATPRSEAEPALNRLVGNLLGSPDAIRLRVVRDPGGVPAGDVSLADLGLQALDLLAILAPGYETGLGELAARAIDACRPADLDDDAPPAQLRLDLRRGDHWRKEFRSVEEIAPFLEELAALVGHARPAGAQDLVLAETAPGTSGDDGTDLDEAARRVAVLAERADTARLALARLLAADPALQATALSGDAAAFLAAHAQAPVAWADREAWRAAILAAAAFGIPSSLPPVRWTTRAEVLAELHRSAGTAFVELSSRSAAARGKGSRSASAVADAARALLGESFRLVPRFAPRNLPELRESLGRALASASTLDGWLQGVAAVREAPARLAAALALADAHGARTPTASVAQLPPAAAGVAEAWVGGPLGPDAPREGRLSLVLLGARDLPPDGSTGAALLVDEWHEVVPSAAETTGIALNYDQPDATPPQCVLLAVPPVAGQPWGLGTLVQTLQDTLDLAKIRTVELEHVQEDLYGQLLPAIVGEVVPTSAASDAAPVGYRTLLNFGANQPPSRGQ